MKRCSALLLLLLAAAACLSGADATRDGVFVGYKEVGVDTGGADGEAASGAGEADSLASDTVEGVLAKDRDSGDGSLHAARDDDAGAGGGGGGAALEEAARYTGRTVLLHTQFGPIRVQMLEQLAPRTTALVLELAQSRGCADCAFYRNEAKPGSGTGPPYALLQGRMPELSQIPPREGNIEVKMGHVCFIPETKDFFVAYGDHPEWENSHTVWGLVDEWFATDLMIAQQYNKVTHPEYGTVMRMLKTEVPFKIAVEGDETYSGLLGPLH